MPNSNSIEVQVNLGLNAAQQQIEALRKALVESVKVPSSAFNNIDTALSQAIRQVSKLRSGMTNAFKTSAGSSRFLKEYDKLFETLGAIGDRFNFLKEGEIIFSPEATTQITNIRNELKTLEQDIKQIDSGKIGKIFEDSTRDDFKAIRDFAAEFKTNLSNVTFDSFKTQLSDAMVNTRKEIAQTEQQVKNLEATINNTALSKDSILNAFKQNNVGQNTLSTVISNNDSARDLRDKIAEAYQEFGITDTKFLNNSVRANSSITSVFQSQEKVITQSADELKEILKNKQKEIETAWEELATMKKTNRNSAGEVVNWQQKLAVVEEISKKFKEINITLPTPSASTVSNGTGIQAYLDAVIEALKQGAANLQVDDVSNALRNKIKEAIDGATTKDIITDTKKFSDQVNTALTEIFGNVNFDIDFSKFKGSSLTDAFASIIASVQSQLKNLSPDELNEKLTVLRERLSALTTAEQLVGQTQESTNGSLAQKQARVEELTNALANLLGVEAGVIRNKIANALQEDSNAANTGREAIEGLSHSMTKLEGKQKSLSNVQSAVTRWMGFYQVLNLTKRAVNDMKQHIQELDTVMTKIAVVTNFSQDDLWKQIGTYSEIARQYGVAIKGVYEVSQIYYQQGLNKSDVMGLTTETLKMARIAGIDYATAADYMTTAIRGFKLEMSEASHVTDVFSNLAAHTASSTEELATAISKTAASAASVGASFEATSAMMATMIATTRESATNIGTALKSIIARYGELKENVTGIDSEGEEYSLNKVDKALQSVGISIHTAAGQFRDFDEVILELGEKWNTIDKNAQRYVATVMAGNRQQSRFLALVSNVEEYKRALELANNADNAGEIQTLKTLDSIDAKIERMKVTIQEFYTSSGIQDLYKNILDTITNVISGANQLPKLFTNIPVYAIAIGTQVIAIIKNVLKLLISSVSNGLNVMKNNHDSLFASLIAKWSQSGRESGQAYAKGVQEGMNSSSGAITATAGKQASAIVAQYAGALAQLGGSSLIINGLSKYGSSTSVKEDEAAGKSTLFGAGLSVLGSGISGAAMGAKYGAAAGLKGIVIGGVIGALVGVVSNISSIISGVNMMTASLSRRIELAQKTLTESQQKATVKKGEVSELQQAYDKLDELYSKQHDSIEAMQEYHEYMNQLAEQYPQLVSEMQTNGDQIIILADLEAKLAEARVDAATAALQALRDEKKLKEDNQESATKFNTKITNSEFDLNEYGLNVQQFGRMIQALSGFSGEAYSWNTEVADWAMSQQTEEAFIMRMYDWATHGYLADSIYADLPEIEGLNTWDNDSEVDLTQLYYQNIDKIHEWYRIILEKDANGLQQAEGWLEESYSETATEYAKVLSTIKDESKGEFDYASLTRGIASTEDEVKKLTGDALIQAIEYTRTLAGQYAEKIKTDINSLDESINTAAINEEIQLQISNADPSTAKKIQKYTNLANFLIRTSEEYSKYNFGEVTVDGGRKYATELFDAVKSTNKWIEQNQEYAEAWSNIDYTKYANYDELVKDTKGLEDSDYEKNFKNVFEKTRNNARLALIEQLSNIFGSEDQIPRTIKNMIGTETEAGTISVEAMPILQSKIKEYKTLKDQGYTIAASNYYSGLINLLQLVSSITDIEDRSAITDIIKTTDLTDIASIDTAISNLEGMIGTENIVAELISLKNKVVTSIGLTVESIVSSSVERVKEVEKTIENIGKGMEYSTALEAAQEILDKAGDKKTLAQSLVYQDIDTGTWMLSQDAIYTSLINTKTEQDKSIKSIVQQLTLANKVVKDQIAKIGDSETFTGNRARKFVLNTKDIDWKELGFETETEFMDAVSQFDGRIQEWLKDYSENKNQYSGWEDYINKRYEELDTAEKKLLASQQDLQNAIKSSLATFDYSAVAGGTYSSSAKTDLQTLLHALDESLDPYFETIWKELLEGKFDQFESLTGLIVSSDTKRAVKSAQVQQYLTAINDLEKPIDAWSKSTLDLLDSHYWTAEITSKYKGQRLEILYDELYNLIDGIDYTIEQYNNDIAALQTKIMGIGRQKATTDLLTGGFKLEEFANYLNSYFEELKIDDYFKNGEFVAEGYEGLFTVDAEGNYQVAANRMAEVIEFFNTVLGAEIDDQSILWKEYLTSETDKKISDLDKADTGKQAANVIQSIASGTVGQRINVENLSAELQQSLDGNTDNIYEIVSEYQRDSWIMALDATAFDDEYKAIVLELQKSIQAKRNKGTLYKNMISKTLDKDTVRSYMDIAGYAESYDAGTYLTNVLKYEYDEFTDTYKATKDSLQPLQNLIDTAKKNKNVSKEYINELETVLNQIKYEFEANPMRDALINLLSNYTNLSDDVLAIFAAQFDISDMSQYYTEDINTGIKKLDITKLKADLGEEWAGVFTNYISQLANSYIDNISSAISLTTSGTTNFTDMDAFTQAYKELFKITNIQTESLFQYNDILDAWQLDPNVLYDFIHKQAQQLVDTGKLSSDQLSSWLKQQGEQIANNVNIADFLSAEDKTVSSDAYKKLAEQMKQYYIGIENRTKLDTAFLITQQIKSLQAGGNAAVNVVKSWAKKQGRDATTEEITNAFNSAITELDTAMEQLGEISKGSIATGKLKTILSKVGGDWKVSSNGVIEAVGDMATVYDAIYKEMQHTAGHTTAGLNAAYAKVLTAQEQGDIDAIEAMSDAFGMTYETLGALLAQSGTDLQTWLRDYSNLYETIGAGKIRITDFTAFAENQGWKPGSEEYTNAFKEYNDSLIEYNNKIKTEIKDEFDALVAAKPNDQINLTRFVSQYGADKVAEVLEKYQASIKDGIATITDQTDLAGIAHELGSIVVADNNTLLLTEVQATVDQLEQQTAIDLSSSLSTMIQNYSAISMDVIRQYAEATKTNYADIIDSLDLEANGDGTYEVDLSKLITLLNDKKEQLGQEVYDSLIELVASISDNVLSVISNATDYLITGTTSQSDIAAFTKSYNDLNGTAFDSSEFFKYNDTLKAFTLKEEYFSDYLARQSGELLELGMSLDDAQNYLRNQVLNTAEANIDIENYLKATDRGAKSQAYDTLSAQIAALLTVRDGQLDESAVTHYISRIEAGGLDAVNAIKELKGSTVTNDEITSVFNASMDRLNTAITDVEKGVGEIISRDSARILSSIKGYTFTDLGNGQYVINSTGEVYAAYKAIYDQMYSINKNAVSSLNDLYAKFITAAAQENNDIKDTLENAFDMSLESFNELLQKYKPNVLLEDALQHQGDWGIQQDIFGNIDIIDFTSFASSMGWEKGSKEFLSAYSTYIDDKIEALNETSSQAIQQKFSEQISSITEAKPGSQVNVSYLSEIFGDLIPTKINDVLKQYNAEINDGILTLGQNANITGITAEILRIAESTRTLLPEQMAELKDTLVNALQEITSTIQSGIEGKLSNVESLNLQNWAKGNTDIAKSLGLISDNNEEWQLSFTQTADGLQLTANSMEQVYAVMKRIDAEQAQTLLPTIQESNASYSSFSAVLNSISAQQEDTTDASAKAIEKFTELQAAIDAAVVKGTVETDYYKRPHIIDEEGNTKTYYSSTYDGDAGHLVLTPILPDGTELTQDGLDQIAWKYLDGEIDLNTKITDEDGKDLKYTLKDIFMGLYDTEDAASAAAQAYHEYHEAVMEAEDSTSSFNATLNSTSDLMRDLVTTMLTDSDNFKFMDNSLPEAMQSVANTYESAYTAMKTLKTASSTGYIELQDFYNIVTTSSSLLEAAGQEFYVNGMTAAELMSKVGDNLVVVDGKLSVDISNTGMDLVGSVDELKSNLTNSIHALAQAQIDMLDAEIEVLEVFAAMEELGEIDVDMDGISFEVEDIFDFSTASKWTAEFENYLTSLKTMADNLGTDSDLYKALNSIKIGGTTMYDLLSAGWEEWKQVGFTQETLSKFFQTIYNTDWANFEGDLQAGIASTLSSLGIGINVDIDGGMYSFSVSCRSFDFKWDDEATMASARAAVQKFYGENLEGDKLREKIETVYNEYQESLQDGEKTLEWEAQWKANVLCAVASGQLNVSYNKNKNEFYAVYHGQTFSGSSESEVQELVAQAMSYEDKGYTFEYEVQDGKDKVKGTKKIGSATIYIDNDIKDKKYTTSAGGQFATEAEAIEYCITEGYGDTSYAGYTVQGGRYEVQVDAELNTAYTFDHSNNEIKYKGNTFNSYEDFANYVTLVEPLNNKEGWTVDTTTKTDYTIYTNGEATIQQNMTTGKLYYSADGITFKSGEDYASYISAKELSDSTGGVIDASTRGQSVITYRLANREIKLEVEEHGTMHYSFSVGSIRFTADSEAGIKQALADYDFFTDTDGEESIESQTSTASYKVTKDGVTLTVDYSADKVTVKSSAGDDDANATTIESKLNEKFQSEVDGTTPTATINNLELELANSDSISLKNDIPLEIKTPIETATGKVKTLKVEAENVEAEGSITDAEIAAMLENATIKVDIDKKQAVEDLDAISKKTDEVDKKEPDIPVMVDRDNSATNKLSALIEQVETLDSLDPTIDIAVNDGATSVISNLISDLESLSGNTYKATVEISTNGGELSGEHSAKGNVGLAKAAGTLMGELGPELVVSNGRYFVAGQNGAEFVNLSNDAIVFNHLQTKQLLKNGVSGSRGKAITNERVATAYAKGNMNGGPALVNASSALATLKSLRSMWQSLLSASASDLAGKGGSGGGGGDDASTRNSYIADVERWYNWLQKIAVLEEKINMEEAKRSKYSAEIIPHGQDYANSLLESLQHLKEEAVTYQALANTQQDYFNKRREELNNTPFNKLYTFDQNGQLKYNDEAEINGNKGGFAFLSDLMTVDDSGKPKYSSEEQYEMLKAAGFADYMKYDSSGNEIDTSQEGWESSAVQAFWDTIDSQKEEMQSLHDSINEYEQDVIEAQQAANEALKEIEDNQIAVEDKVLSALEDMRQRAIDDLQDEVDAMQDAADSVVDGLSEQLEKERELYENQQAKDELTTLQRQLAILKRSGGSASQIASLESQISDKQYDMYFDAQQDQIDALQEASDAQIEKLNEQIDLMTETLEYEKAHGLLWNEVYEVMKGSPEEIADYIFQNDSQFWGESPTKQTQSYREALFKAQQFVTYRDTMTKTITDIASDFSNDSIQTAAKLEEISSKIDTVANSSGGSGGSSSTTDTTTDTSSGSGGSSSSGGSGGSTPSGGTKKSWHVEGLSETYESEAKAKTARESWAQLAIEQYNTLRDRGDPSYYSWYGVAMSRRSAAIKYYKQGGLADYTGLAMMHGSKTKPESVLTSKQTNILRNEILSNKSTSLLSLLTDFREAYNSLPSASTYSNISNDNGINIDNIKLEMNVASIANDYDAQRAGEQALNKMVSIARKTAGKNRIGR